MNKKEEFSKIFEISNRLVIFLRKNNNFDLVENESDYLELIDREASIKGFNSEFSKTPVFRKSLKNKLQALIDEHENLPYLQNLLALNAGENLLLYLNGRKCILENKYPIIFKDDIGYTIFVKVKEKFNDGVDSPHSFFGNVFHYLKKQYLVTQDPKIFIEHLRKSSIKYKENRIREREIKKYKDIIDKTVAELGIKQ